MKGRAASVVHILTKLEESKGKAGERHCCESTLRSVPSLD